MERKYYELLYLFMKDLKFDDKHLSYVKTRALGVVKPAKALVDTGADLNGNVFSAYKDCVRLAIHRCTAIGCENVCYPDYTDNIYVEEFADLVQNVYKYVLEYLHGVIHNDFLINRKEIVVQWCEEFRFFFTQFEKCVREVCLETMPFFQKELNFEKGVLVRSVAALKKDNGFWGVDYPIISTSIFQTNNPNWYLKGWRSIMLVYSLDDSEDVLAMFPKDGNTYCKFNPEPFINDCVEKMLMNDRIEDAYFDVLYPSFQVAYTFEQLLQSTEICEIVLKSNVRPKGVLVGDMAVYLQNEDLKKQVELFAAYYELPIYGLENNVVHPVINSRD